MRLRRSRILQLAAFAVVAGCALLASGCAGVTFEHVTPVEGHRVDVTVTENSARALLVRHSLPFTTGMTALDALKGVADVRVDKDGDVIQVNGKEGGTAGPFGPVEARWTYRINGIEPNVPASQFQLRAGMSVWFDLRRTDIYPRIPVAIGVFPEPLLDGYRDDERPLQITYSPGFQSDAYEFQKLLQRLDPSVNKLQEQDGTLDTKDQELPYIAVNPNRSNLVIGRWEDIEMDPYITDIETDPRKFGLTVWIEGHDIWEQAPDEDFPKELPNADGVVFATTIDGQPDSPIVFVVTGVTDAGVKAAAHALHSGAMQFYLSAAVDSSGTVIP